MATTVSEERILQALRQVPTERWPDVLQYVHALQTGSAGSVDRATLEALADNTWTAAELHQSPRPTQDAILRLQAARLVTQHQDDPHCAVPLLWWNAGEIGRLSIDQRDILLEASAIVADDEYHTNAELTAFDAFGEDDLNGDSASGEFLDGSNSTTDAR